MPKINNQETKIFLIICVITIGFLVVSPMLQQFIVSPQSDFFTEMWLMGSDKTAENYPYNITSGETYSVFINIHNNLETDASYMILVKFRNLTQSAPDVFEQTPSSLSPIYEIPKSIAVGETVEIPIDFSFNYEHIVDPLKIIFGDVIINDTFLSLEGSSIMYTYQRQMFFGNLIFELWIYDENSNSYQYSEQCVDLKLSFKV